MPFDEIQEAARAQFDRQSHLYGASHILADVADVDELLARLPASTQHPGAALDVATGAGHTGLRLAELGWQVTLADISQSMLDRAKEAADSRGLRIETNLHSAESLPYPDASFDLVSCRVAAHHFSSPPAFVQECSRVLRPGGSFLLIDGSVPDDEPEAEEWLHQVEKHRDPSHGRFLRPATWKALCTGAGFDVLVCEFHPLKQPDLEWYFETAATSAENRQKVHELIATASPHVRSVFRLDEENGKTVWWWPRLSLLAVKKS